MSKQKKVTSTDIKTFIISYLTDSLGESGRALETDLAEDYDLLLEGAVVVAEGQVHIRLRGSKVFGFYDGFTIPSRRIVGAASLVSRMPGFIGNSLRFYAADRM